MSLEQENKKIVQSWIDALNSKDTTRVLHIYADDIQIITMGKTLISGQYGPDQVKQFVTGVLDVFPQGLSFTLHSMIAEGDKVAAEATATGMHVSGQEYTQDYHFVITIKEGKISVLKEYLDTEIVTKVICSGQRP